MKHPFLPAIALLLLLTGNPSAAQVDTVNKFPNGRTLIKKNDLYSVIDPNGKNIFNTEWNELRRYNNNYWYIRKTYNDSAFVPATNSYQKFDRYKQGVLSRTTGHLVIPPLYDGISDFINGRAVVKNNKLSGILSEDGSVVIPLQYENIKILENGNYLLADTNHVGHFLDPQLKKIASVKGIASMQPTKMKCVYAIIKDSAGGFIDCNGAYVVNKQWREVDRIENNMVFVIGKNAYGIYHLRLKRMLFETIYKRYEYNSETNTLLLNKDDQWFIADTTGKIKPGWQGDHLTRFTNGHYFYSYKGLWGLVHPASGKLVKPTWEKFEGVQGQKYFKAILPGQSWSYFDLNGKPVNDPASLPFRDQ